MATMETIEEIFGDLIEKWKKDGLSPQLMLDEADVRVNGEALWKNWLPVVDVQKVGEYEPFDPLKIGLRSAKRNSELHRGIRLIQRYTTDFDDSLDVWLRSWDYSSYGGPGRTDELNISFGDVSEKAKLRIAELLQRWLEPKATVDEMQEFLEQEGFLSE